MKRRGCTVCHLIEPRPGDWRKGICPRCAEAAAKVAPAKPAETSAPVKDAVLEATVARLREYLARIAIEFPEVWKNIDRLRSERGRTLPQWPSWCFMPVAGAYAIASGGRDDAPPESMGKLAALAALAAWRPTQGIYRFDPVVSAALMDTPITGEIPTEILHRLPEWCVYIATPDMTYLGAPAPGFFAFIEHDANDGHEELRICIDSGDGQLHTALPVYLDRGGLLAGIEAAQAEAARQVEKHWATAGAEQWKSAAEAVEKVLSIPPEMSADEMRPRINLLLYLCSTNAEMLERKTGRLRPSKPLLTRTKDGLRMFPADRAATWDVGYRLGAAIRHAQDAEARKAGDGTHASPRPHIRRAHWHSFWTGPKTKVGVKPAADRALVLKWLPPTPVNIDEEREASVIPTIHEVKN